MQTVAHAAVFVVILIGGSKSLMIAVRPYAANSGDMLFVKVGVGGRSGGAGRKIHDGKTDSVCRSFVRD